VFGSTSQTGDMNPEVRATDHADNLARLALLCGAGVGLAPGDLSGRTAWRWVSSDRMPVIGAVPEPDPADTGSTFITRLDQPRFVPRQPGLFVFTALGSRGISWSALGAQVLASSVSGAPSPLEASLLDAVDPARFVSRAVRRRSAG
jgi:tRNA 5-methylaminomethyl-2-thiouridine biosynthesis bifunctional protein